MESAVSLPWSKKVNWSYVSLQVRDGDRMLKPSHVSFDRLVFTEPPLIESLEVEVIITNGDAVDRRKVTVLPHNASDTQIPIRQPQ